MENMSNGGTNTHNDAVSSTDILKNENEELVSKVRRLEQTLREKNRVVYHQHLLVLKLCKRIKQKYISQASFQTCLDPFNGQLKKHMKLDMQQNCYEENAVVPERPKFRRPTFPSKNHRRERFHPSLEASINNGIGSDYGVVDMEAGTSNMQQESTYSETANSHISQGRSQKMRSCLPERNVTCDLKTRRRSRDKNFSSTLQNPSLSSSEDVPGNSSAKSIKTRSANGVEMKHLNGSCKTIQAQQNSVQMNRSTSSETRKIVKNSSKKLMVKNSNLKKKSPIKNYNGSKKSAVKNSNFKRKRNTNEKTIKTKEKAMSYVRHGFSNATTSVHKSKKTRNKPKLAAEETQDGCKTYKISDIGSNLHMSPRVLLTDMFSNKEEEKNPYVYKSKREFFEARDKSCIMSNKSHEYYPSNMNIETENHAIEQGTYIVNVMNLENEEPINVEPVKKKTSLPAEKNDIVNENSVNSLPSNFSSKTESIGDSQADPLETTNEYLKSSTSSEDLYLGKGPHTPPGPEPETPPRGPRTPPGNGPATPEESEDELCDLCDEG